MNHEVSFYYIFSLIDLIVATIVTLTTRVTYLIIRISLGLCYNHLNEKNIQRSYVNKLLYFRSKGPPLHFKQLLV